MGCLHAGPNSEDNLDGQVPWELQTVDTKGDVEDEHKPSLLVHPSAELWESSSSSTESHEEVHFHNERCPVTINETLTQAYKVGGQRISKHFKKECAVLKKEFLVHSLHTHASVDPEVFSKVHSTQPIKDEIIRREATKRMTTSARRSTYIPVKHGVRICYSFQQYHAHRDNLIEPYEVILQKHDPNWKLHAQRIIAMLEAMNCHVQWARLEHIGSTAIEGLVAKPIVDLMIVLLEDQDFEKCFNQILEEQEKIESLPIKIGFTSKAPGSDDDWGFFQVPHTAAHALKMCEVNIHIFLEGSQNAVDKLIFRDFLIAEEGKSLRAEYGRVKLDLMEQLERNELSVSQYSRSKNEIVAQILVAAKKWKAGDIVIHRTSLFVKPRVKGKKEEPESDSEDSIKIGQLAPGGPVPGEGPGTGGISALKKSLDTNVPKKRYLSYYSTRSGLSSHSVLSENLSRRLNNVNLTSSENLGSKDPSGEKPTISDPPSMKYHKSSSSKNPNEVCPSIISAKDKDILEGWRGTSSRSVSIRLGQC